MDNPQNADDFYAGVDLCAHLLSDVGYETLPMAFYIDSVAVMFPRPCPIPHNDATGPLRPTGG